MKMKKALIRSAIIVAIILLSVGIGFISQTIGHRLDLKKYPRDFSTFVEKYAGERGIPEDVVYGVIKYVSGFSSNHVGENGGVGLMGLTPTVFDRLLAGTKEDLTEGILYDPETNIRYGTLYLSELYNAYGRWEQVYAAVVAGEEKVNGWRADTSLLGDKGKLTIPDKAVASGVKEISKIVDKYKALYY